MMNVIAGSVLGGLALAFTQRVLPGMLIMVFGPWIAGYQPLVPILVIVVVLLVEPEGITGILSKGSGRVRRLRGAVSQLIHWKL